MWIWRGIWIWRGKGEAENRRWSYAQRPIRPSCREPVAKGQDASCAGPAAEGLDASSPWPGTLSQTDNRPLTSTARPSRLSTSLINPGYADQPRRSTSPIGLRDQTRLSASALNQADQPSRSIKPINSDNGSHWRRSRVSVASSLAGAACLPGNWSEDWAEDWAENWPGNCPPASRPAAGGLRRGP